jgi:DNA-binding MarR family transcriptional regulator
MSRVLTSRYNADVDEIDRIVAEWQRVRPDLDVSPTETLQRITRLSLLLSASFTEFFARHDLTWGEYLVLAALRRAGPPFRMNPTALFRAVILSSGAMTSRLDRLEEMGLVRRLSDPNDRRGRLVELTTKGRLLVDRLVVDHLANEQRLLEALNASERDRLAGLLRKLLLSAPFQSLDPAIGAPVAEPSGSKAAPRGRQGRRRLARAPDDER